MTYFQPQNQAIVSFANSFRCNECKHRGASDLWPNFKENDSKDKLYRLENSLVDIECSQLKCYYTKLNFKQNQLGLGLYVTKIPKTGMIKEAIIFEDYISIKAVVK